MKLIKLITTYTFITFLLPLNTFGQEDFDEKELEKPIEFPGSVPRENPVMQARFQTISFEQADKLYRENVANANESDYKGNLEAFGFLLVMKNGLIANGTEVQKKYYIDQQLKAENSLANIKRFYELLLDASSFMEEEIVKDLSHKFIQKNEETIASLQWQTKEAKKKKSNELYLEARKFGRFLEREKLNEQR